MSDRPCSSAEARQFDFWLGEWDVTWPTEQAGGEAGERGSGTNRITRMFGDCVIEENFSNGDGSFTGHSVSVYDERAALWRQTWVDSDGNYLWFTGRFDGQAMDLRTEPIQRESGIAVYRMLWSDISEDSLEWAWQVSPDQGDTWRDLWNISYRRRGT